MTKINLVDDTNMKEQHLFKVHFNVTIIGVLLPVPSIVTPRAI